MNKIEKVSISLLISCVLLLLCYAGIAYAEEVDINASASANVEVQTGKPRPLQILHDAKMELKERTEDELKTLKREGVGIRNDTKMEWKTASSGSERREVVKEGRAEMKANLKERLQVLFRTHLGNAVNRMNIAIQHFENLVDRIEARIGKLKERGIATTSIEAKLDVAVDDIASAKADIAAFSSIASSTTDQSSAEDVKAQLRASLNKARESIKAAHRALVATVQELTAVVRANASANAEINSTTTLDAENDAVE